MNLFAIDDQWIYGFFLNFILIGFSYRFPLLTTSGWINAGVLGTILFGCLGWRGWLSVVIYLSLGSLVTKLGFSYKKSKGIAEARDGRRGPENVWGSAATGAIMAIIFKLSNGLNQSLILIGFAASFAAKLADTFGSEIGKRWGKNTFLITNFKPMPPGTDGAISFEGTLASVLGSLLMSTVMSSLGFLTSYRAFLIVFICGFIATLLESVLGALVQEKISWLTNELINFFQTTISCLLAILTAYIFL